MNFLCWVLTVFNKNTSFNKNNKFTVNMNAFVKSVCLQGKLHWLSILLTMVVLYCICSPCFSFFLLLFSLVMLNDCIKASWEFTNFILNFCFAIFAIISKLLVFLCVIPKLSGFEILLSLLYWENHSADVMNPDRRRKGEWSYTTEWP